jgi:hypothetical protein
MPHSDSEFRMLADLPEAIIPACILEFQDPDMGHPKFEIEPASRNLGHPSV